MVRIVGDIHGKIHPYVRMVRDVNYSIQIGDFGFKGTYNSIIHDFKWDEQDQHIFIPGNHDDYYNLPNFNIMAKKGKSYGVYTHGGLTFFFIRGGFSIDRQWRVEGVSWWPCEELNHIQSTNCIEAYEEVKPDVVISHDCPLPIYSFVLTNPLKSDGNHTAKLLANLLEIHEPSVWFFGHHHNTRTIAFKNTVFQCLGELDYADVKDVGGNVVSYEVNGKDTVNLR